MRLVLLLTLLAVSLSAGAKKKKVDIVIIGGGPAGLGAAIQAKQANSNLDIVVIEKRPKKRWAARERVVFLEERNFAALHRSFGLTDLKYSKMENLRLYSHGQEYNFAVRDPWVDIVRSFLGILSNYGSQLKEIEKSALRRAEALGIKVKFGSSVEAIETLYKDGSPQKVLSVKGKNQTQEFLTETLVIADGADSETLKRFYNVGSNHFPSRGSLMIGADYYTPNMGANFHDTTILGVHSPYDNTFSGAFSSHQHTSISISVPPQLIDSIGSDPELQLEIIERTRRSFNIDGEMLGKPFVYDTTISATKVVFPDHNTILLGDSLGKTDSNVGLGVNKAILNALSFGEWIAGDISKTALGRDLVDSTIFSLEGSMYIQDYIRFLQQLPEGEFGKMKLTMAPTDLINKVGKKAAKVPFFGLANTFSLGAFNSFVKAAAPKILEWKGVPEPPPYYRDGSLRTPVNKIPEIGPPSPLGDNCQGIMSP